MNMFDLSPLYESMGQMDQAMRPSPEQEAADRRRFLQTFLMGLVGAPKGGEFQQAGRAGMLALADRDRQAQLRMEQRHNMLQDTAAALQLQGAMNQFRLGQDQRDIESGAFGGGSPSAQQQPAPTFGMNDRGLGTAPAGAPASPAPSPVAGASLPPAAGGGAPQGQSAQMLRDFYLRAAEIAKTRGRGDLAQMYVQKAVELEKAMQPEYYGDFKSGLDENGNPVFLQASKHGAPQRIGGVTPPPEMVFERDATGALQAFDKLRTKPGMVAGPGMTQKEMADAAARKQELGIQGGQLAVSRANSQETGRHNRATEGLTAAKLPGEQAQVVSAIRKELNGLPDVQNYRAVAPIINSMAKSPDTKAGDLDMIYGVGKILDPGSVVREGELVLVKDTANLPQKFLSYWAILNGGGRLSPSQRADLMNMVGNRVGQLKLAHDAAIAPYQRQAGSLGLPLDQILVEPPAVNTTPRFQGFSAVEKTR